MNKSEILPELEKLFDSGWIGLGPKTTEFEERFAEFIGVRHAVAVNSATAALHLANKSIGITTGSQVIVPAMTFVSTVFSILYCGGDPIFADIEEDTLCIDPKDVERKLTPLTRAVIPVHFGGHACRMAELMEMCHARGVSVIEDAAHACGGRYLDKHLGAIGKMGCFSFHAVKNLPTGDGGMITTNDSELSAKMKKLRWLGISRDTWDRATGASYSWSYTIDEVGYKYHMNDITAVIGLAQLKTLECDNQKRRALVQNYNRAFEKIGWITTPAEKPYAYSSCHNYVIRVPMRNELNKFLKEHGVSTGVHYAPVHQFEIFAANRPCLPVTERVWEELLTLPLFPDLSVDAIDKIVELILSFGRNKGL